MGAAKMVRFLKSGKVVIVLQGRYAGIERYPLKVTRGMSQKKVKRRSTIKPFVRLINYNHLMPTRYTIDVDVKSVVNKDVLSDPSKKLAARKAVKAKFEERYSSGKNKWFFSKLRF